MRMSKSKVLLYEQCPFKFKLQEIDKIKPEVEPEAFIKGTTVHKLAENLYVKELTEEEVLPAITMPKEIANKFIIEKKIEKIKESEEYKKYPESAEKFFGFAKRTNSIPLYTEEKMFDDELNIVGIVDRIDFQKNKLILTDYKTGKAGDIKDYRFELAVYVYLFEKNHNQKITHWGIYFIDEDLYVGEPVIRGEITNAISKIQEVRDCVKQQKFDKKFSWKCRFCAYKGKECV